MPSQQEIVDLLRADYPFLTAEYGVKRLGIFGSFAPGPARQATSICWWSFKSRSA